MNYVTKCNNCNTHIHTLRKRYCCGIDYLEVLRIEEDKKKTKKKKSYRKGINKKLKEKVLKRDGYKCTSCSSEKDLHLHHKKHRKHGGEDTEENLITLCLICHAKEHQTEQVYNLMMKRTIGA